MWTRTIRHIYNTSVKFESNLKICCNPARNHKFFSNNLKRAVSSHRVNIKPHGRDNKHSAVSNCNSFTYRTHTCGELRLDHVGQKVTLCGWIQYVRLSKFILIRDSYGITQCMVKNTSDQYNLPLETTVKIEGSLKQ